MISRRTNGDQTTTQQSHLSLISL